MNQSATAQENYKKARRYLIKYFGDTDHFDYLHDAFIVWYDKTGGKENLYDLPVGTIIRVIKNLILKKWSQDYSYMKDGEKMIRQISSTPVGEPIYDTDSFLSQVTPYDVMVAEDVYEKVNKIFSEKHLLKQKVFSYFAEGWSVHQISEVTELSIESISSYLNQYKNNGCRNDYLYVFDKMVEGYRHVEIAEQLEVTPSYVWWLVNNIRQTVSKMI